MEVEIRRATADDAIDIAGVHHRGWQWGYRGLVPDAILDGFDLEARERRWRDLLAEAGRPGREWVAVAGARVVGFVAAGPPLDPDEDPATGEVYVIYLEEEAAGSGVGSALMRVAVRDLWEMGFERATLWVLETNARARRFYERGGWVADGAVKTEDLEGFTLHEVRYVLRR